MTLWVCCQLDEHWLTLHSIIDGYAEFQMDVLFAQFLLTLPALLIVMLVAGVCSLISKKNCFKWGLGIYGLFLLLLAGVRIYDIYESPESKLQGVLHCEIPEGISNIEMAYIRESRDPIYYFSFELTPAAYRKLKDQRGFSIDEKGEGIKEFDSLLFPQGWKERYEQSLFETYRCVSDTHTFHYLLYSQKEKRAIYAVITT